MHLLICEDEVDLADSLRAGLEELDYRVDLAYDGEEAETKALQTDYDALIVDWMLPGRDGPELVRRLRDDDVRVPVLMLTARADVDDRIEGLDAGADDYLTKPFSFRELEARLRALIRRASTPLAEQTKLAAGPLDLDLIRRTAKIEDEEIGLRPKEFDLLVVLVRHLDETLPRPAIAEQVWGTTQGVTNDVINMTISELRHHLRDAQEEREGERVVIETIRGTGYRLVVQ